MNRRQFLDRAVGSAGCCAAFAWFGDPVLAQTQAPAPPAPDPDKQFIQNWLADLMEAIDGNTEEPMKARLIGLCGRACFERFDFKRTWAVEGRGDVEKLIAALKKNFRVEREGNLVHIRYGLVAKGCYCPAAKYRPPKPNDIHCYCSRGSHQAVWETALGRPINVELVESVRRGGKTCHFVVHLDA